MGLGSYLMLAKLFMASCFISEPKVCLGSSSISTYRTKRDGMGGTWQPPEDTSVSMLNFPRASLVHKRVQGSPCPHFQPTAYLPTWTFAASRFSRQKASKLSDVSLHLHSVQMLLRNLIFCCSSW